MLLAGVVAVTLVACGESDDGRQPRSREPATDQPVVTPQSPEVTEKPQKHPNVLVIEADDMRWDDLRLMPNVRRLLQRRGLTFENSFAPYPLCCPSRASFLTGQLRAQPPRLQPRGAVRLRGVPRPAHDRHGAAEGGVPHRPGRQVPQRVRRAATSRTGGSSLHYVPPGWTQWMAGSDHLWHTGDPFRGGTYDYFNLSQNVNGEI